MIRAKDLAAKLGVSAATVSLVLNDKPGICDDTRRELRKRIVDMGYGYMLKTPEKKAAAAAEGKEKGIKGLPAKVGMEMAAEMIAKIKDEKLCDGVHVMAIGAEKNVPKILDMAGLSI